MMDWRLFWIHESHYESGDPQVGFSLFSVPHLPWLAPSLAFVVTFTVCHRAAEKIRRDDPRKAMAYFLVMFELFHQCTQTRAGAPMGQILPLHFCSHAKLLIPLDALWPTHDLQRQLLALAFLPAALIALALPTVTCHPPISAHAIHQFVMHAGIVAYVVARHAAFGTNCLFLMAHHDNPAPKAIWDLSGGSGGLPYVLSLIALVALIMHVTLAVLTLVDRARGVRPDAPAHLARKGRHVPPTTDDRGVGATTERTRPGP